MINWTREVSGLNSNDHATIIVNLECHSGGIVESYSSEPHQLNQDPHCIVPMNFSMKSLALSGNMQVGISVFDEEMHVICKISEKNIPG